MHLTRKSSTIKLPIERKGTKYIARASSHLSNSVPVVIAVRDMLKLAKTAKEVREMIKNKLLKLNFKHVKDYRESVRLFNILEADKLYELLVLPTKKFAFVPAKNKDQRLCKVTNKTLLGKSIIQLNLHDGTNVLSKEKIKVEDSVYLDKNNKIKSHISIEKGKKVFVFSGRYAGNMATISEISGKIVSIKLDGGSAEISVRSVIAL